MYQVQGKADTQQIWKSYKVGDYWFTYLNIHFVNGINIPIKRYIIYNDIKGFKNMSMKFNLNTKMWVVNYRREEDRYANHNSNNKIKCCLNFRGTQHDDEDYLD